MQSQSYAEVHSKERLSSNLANVSLQICLLDRSSDALEHSIKQMKQVLMISISSTNSK